MFLKLGTTQHFLLIEDALRRGKVDAPNVIRNSFYASFIHVFKKMFFLNKPGGIGTGFIIGRAKTFDTKIFSWWVNLSVLF